jgi:hypothetical protein
MAAVIAAGSPGPGLVGVGWGALLGELGCRGLPVKDNDRRRHSALGYGRELSTLQPAPMIDSLCLRHRRHVLGVSVAGLYRGRPLGR